MFWRSVCLFRVSESTLFTICCHTCSGTCKNGANWLNNPKIKLRYAQSSLNLIMLPSNITAIALLSTFGFIFSDFNFCGDSKNPTILSRLVDNLCNFFGQQKITIRCPKLVVDILASLLSFCYSCPFSAKEEVTQPNWYQLILLLIAMIKQKGIQSWWWSWLRFALVVCSAFCLDDCVCFVLITKLEFRTTAMKFNSLCVSTDWLLFWLFILTFNISLLFFFFFFFLSFFSIFSQSLNEFFPWIDFNF